MSHISHHIATQPFGLGQVSRHAVKGLAQFGDLGTARFRHPLGQVALGDAVGGGGEPGQGCGKLATEGQTQHDTQPASQKARQEQVLINAVHKGLLNGLKHLLIRAVLRTQGHQPAHSLTVHNHRHGAGALLGA